MHAAATKRDLRAFATKKDLQTFAVSTDARFTSIEKRLDGCATKDDLNSFATKVDNDLREVEKHLCRHVTIMYGQLLHDFKGIFADRLSQFDDRLVRVERHLGFPTPR